MVKALQAKINAMQGFGKMPEEPVTDGLMPFSSAFPGNVFPTGAIHEFISYEPVEAASTSGFISALAGSFMKPGSLCLWIAKEKMIFPPALKQFGIEPDRMIFIKVLKPKDTLWTIEEALKCEALTAVIGEVKELGFTESRRLQLAVEQSGVTAFIHRFRPFAENATACTARWKITPLASSPEEGLPGLGHSCWDVQLLKVRNGSPHSWPVTWAGGCFRPLVEKQFSAQTQHARNAG
ncbi:ImuA family protein [Flavobacterium magnum]|nr:hypothetical protein [Flavobacterium magnum]